MSRLSDDEMKGKYGSALGVYANNDEKFDVTLFQTPCKEPLCCCASGLLICPVSIYMRHKVLNHVNPGSGWSDYKCCQEKFGGCCCFKPGHMGESTCPCPCMCLEAFCCTGPAVSATSMVIRDKYYLGLDESDVRLIRCNNCLFCLATICSCIAMFTNNEDIDAASSIINCISDVVFCCTSGCMTAQVNREMKLKKRGTTEPGSQMMDR